MTVEMMLRGERLKAEEALAEKDAVIETLEQKISAWEQKESAWEQKESAWEQEKAAMAARIAELEKQQK